MPVLRRSTDHTGLVIEAPEGDPDARYALSEEGERFLALVLGLHPGDTVRDKDLTLLIDRGWATRLAPPAPSPPVPAPRPSTPSRHETHSVRPAASRRTRGREVALQVLYLTEQNPEVEADEVERFLVRRLRDPKLVDDTRALVEGVRAHLAQIDERISSVAENWRLDRMAAIDRNILRLGVYEMHHRDDVPVKVAINEALELAKRYSTAQSSRFVNGILDRLQTAPDASTAPADAPPVPPSPSGEGQAEGPTEAPAAAISPPPSRPGSPPLASRGVAGRASSNLPLSSLEGRGETPPTSSSSSPPPARGVEEPSADKPTPESDAASPDAP